MAQLPGGTVTLLFTDIEGSTALLQVLGDRYGILLADHNRILRGAFAAQGGSEVDSAGDGLFTTFPSARAGLLGAMEAQRGIAAATWPGDATVRVRMGLHTGEPRSGEGGYVGLDVHRAARICAAGHGGQIIVSQTSRDLLTNDLPADVSSVDLGEHRLKGIDEAQHLYQVAAPGLATSFAPLRTAGGRPNNLPRELTSFVGRDRQLEAASRILATTPLLTLVGPGGVGKTRLALRLAVEHLDEYDEGAWLVELGSVEDGASSSRPSPRRWPSPSSRARTSRRPSSTTSGRAAGCWSSTTASTSSRRRRPRSSASSRPARTCASWRPVARASASPARRSTRSRRCPFLRSQGPAAAAVGRSEAVALFVERAAAVRPEFRVGSDNAAAIAQLVPAARRDPAGARAGRRPDPGRSTVDQIAARLDDRFRLLAGGSRVAVPRHQTLQATMDWSYDLLTDDERAAPPPAGGLRRAAVDSRPPRSVCGERAGRSRSTCSTCSTRLVDKSLVVAEPTGDGPLPPARDPPPVRPGQAHRGR